MLGRIPHCCNKLQVQSNSSKTTFVDRQTDRWCATDRSRCSTPTSSASSAPISLGTCSNVLVVGVPSYKCHPLTTAIHETYMPHSDCYCLYAQTVQLCITQSIMSVLHTLPILQSLLHSFSVTDWISSVKTVMMTQSVYQGKWLIQCPRLANYYIIVRVWSWVYALATWQNFVILSYSTYYGAKQLWTNSTAFCHIRDINCKTSLKCALHLLPMIMTVY